MMQAWTALWRGWYHLFLPRWLALGPLVLFADELAQPERALEELRTFLRLPRPELVMMGNNRDRDAQRGSNVSAVTFTMLRSLTADAVVQTDRLLRERRGGKGVPSAWRVPSP